MFESRRIPQALNQFESQSKTRSTPPGPNNPGMRGPHPGGPPGPHPGGNIIFEKNNTYSAFENSGLSQNT